MSIFAHAKEFATVRMMYTFFCLNVVEVHQNRSPANLYQMAQITPMMIIITITYSTNIIKILSIFQLSSTAVTSHSLLSVNLCVRTCWVYNIVSTDIICLMLGMRVRADYRTGCSVVSYVQDTAQNLLPLRVKCDRNGTAPIIRMHNGLSN